MQELKENDILCSIVFATCLGVLLLRIAQKHTCHVEHNSWMYLVFILANQENSNNYTCHVEHNSWIYLVFILANQITANFEI